MQLVKHKSGDQLLIFKPPDEKKQQCLKFCRKSKTNPNLFAVDWNAYNKHALESMGIATPDLTALWHWPGRYTPWEHQVITAEQMLLNRRLWNLLDMRLGKTYASGQAIEFGLKYGMFKRVLILAPKSIIRSVWQPEMFWINPKRNVYLGDGPVKEMEDVLQGGHAEIVCANHDKVKFCIDELLDWKPDLVVIDESSKFKHDYTDKFHCFKALADDPKTWVWLLTGTPCPKSPLDIYGLACIIDSSFKERFPFKSRWQEHTMFKATNWQGEEEWRPKANWKELVAQALFPSVRFTKSQVFDMPPLSFETRDVSLNKEQKALVSKIVKNQKATVATGKRISVAHGADALNKLFQVCGGVVYDEDGNPNVLGNAVKNRVKEIIDIHEESGSKVILFCGYVDMMLEYQKEIEKQTGFECPLLIGKTSPKKRAEIQRRFQEDDDVQFVLGHWEVMQYGMKLTAGNNSVYITPATRPEYWSQSNERMLEEVSATKESVAVTLLCSSKQEKRAYARLREDAENEQNILTTTDLYREVFVE